MLTLPVSIECTKEGVKFSCQGDIGSGSVQLRQHTNVEKPGENVEIDLSEPVALTFSLKYLVNFCKASGLSESVKLSLSSEVPLLVEYTLSSNSYLRFYLAPKVSRRACLDRRVLTIADWRRGVGCLVWVRSRGGLQRWVGRVGEWAARGGRSLAALRSRAVRCPSPAARHGAWNFR